MFMALDYPSFIMLQVGVSRTIPYLHRVRLWIHGISAYFHTEFQFAAS